MSRQKRRPTPKRSKQAGDRRPDARGHWKDQRHGTRGYTSWVSEARLTSGIKIRKPG